MRVKELLEQKGTEVYSVGMDESVFEALKIMAEKEVGALVVLEEGRMLGILSERDYARKVILSGKKSEETTVGEIMTTDVVFANPNDKVEKCLSKMSKKWIFSLF